MGMTQEEKQSYIDIIEETGRARMSMLADRTVPEECLAWQAEVTQEERLLELEGIVPVRVVVSKANELAGDAPIHVNMHGGGYWSPQNEDDDYYCAHVAAATHGIVIDVDYALSPNYAFPTAFEQSYAVCKWASEHAEELGGSARRLSVGGHSAGGCLAAAISMRAVATHDFELCLQVLDYCAIDNMASVIDQSNQRFYAFSMLLCDGDVRLLKSPYCSPCFADDAMLKGNPKTLIVNAKRCPFKEPMEEFGRRLAMQGTEVTIKCFMESQHGFTVRRSGEWHEAQELIIRQVNESGL